MGQAEEQVIKFLKDMGIKEQMCPLAGNSVHMDKAFLRKDMPRLHNFLHYRIVDVSTVKELVARWMPAEF